MNRGEVRTAIRYIIAEPHENGTWTNAMLNSFIDRAYKMLANVVRNRNYKYYYSTTTLTTTATVRYVALPTDCVSSNVLNIRNAEGYSLVPDDIVNMSPEDTANKATFYDILDNKVYFDPVPSDAETYTLEYFRIPNVLSLDATELDFPQGQEDVVAWKAATMAKKSLDDISQFIASEYEDMYESMLKSIMINKYIRPPMIKISRGHFGKGWINNGFRQGL